MAQLTNPIGSQNIVDRFADYVPPAANQGITWGTNAVPFGEMSTAYFGGDTGGKGIGINGNSIGSTGSTITAQGIYNTVLNETKVYTRIRRMRAVLFVDGGGGNSGSRTTPGVVYDSTAMSHLNDNYQQIISVDQSDLYANNTISAGGLDSLFASMRAVYNSARENTTTIQINVCHASCHSSCHSSRGRR